MPFRSDRRKRLHNLKAMKKLMKLQIDYLGEIHDILEDFYTSPDHFDDKLKFIPEKKKKKINSLIEKILKTEMRRSSKYASFTQISELGNQIKNDALKQIEYYGKELAVQHQQLNQLFLGQGCDLIALFEQAEKSSIEVINTLKEIIANIQGYPGRVDGAYRFIKGDIRKKIINYSLTNKHLGVIDNIEDVFIGGSGIQAVLDTNVIVDIKRDMEKEKADLIGLDFIGARIVLLQSVIAESTTANNKNKCSPVIRYLKTLNPVIETSSLPSGKDRQKIVGVWNTQSSKGQRGLDPGPTDMKIINYAFQRGKQGLRTIVLSSDNDINPVINYFGSAYFKEPRPFPVHSYSFKELIRTID